MVLRDPRSPEPRGSHTFVGPIPSDRLSPRSGVPDPLLITTLGSTSAPLTVGYLTWASIGLISGGAGGGSAIVVADDLKPNSSETIGVSGTPFANGYFTTFNVDNIRRLTSSATLATSASPFSIISGTRLNVSDVYAIGSNVAFHNHIWFSSGSLDIGSSSVGLRKIYVDALDVAGIGDITVHADLKPNGSETIGVSGTPFTEGRFVTTITNTLSSINDSVVMNKSLDIAEKDLHGIRVITTNPTVASMEIGEIILGDTGGGANTGRIFIKVNATEIYSFVSDAIIT